MSDAATLPEIRAALDRALSALPSIDDPTVAVVAAERALARGLEHVYVALAELGDHATFRDRAQRATDEVRAALGHLMETPTENEAVERVSAAVAACLGRLQQLRWSIVDGVSLPRSDAGPLHRATHGWPQLLTLGRGVLRPGVPLDEPSPAPPEDPPVVLPAPATREEMPARAAALETTLAKMVAPAKEPEPAAAEPAAAAAPGVPVEDAEALRFGRAWSEEELRAARARDLVDELAMLGRMRRGTPPERWEAGEETERRLLTRVDGIAACGAQAFSTLVRMLDDRPLPDPELTFANLFFLLSVAGDDTFDQAARLLGLAPLDDPEMWAMCVDAFVLGPHPRIEAFLYGWLSAVSPARRHLAVEVLRRRRTLSREALDGMASDEHRPLLASLARALGTAPERPTPGALAWSVTHDDEEVVRAGLEAALRQRDPVGYARAVELVQSGRGAFADAAVVVALAGDESSFPILEAALATDGSAVALTAAGWYGDARLVPFLLDRLERGDAAQKAAALGALERITGASIVGGVSLTDDPDHPPFVRERRPYEPPGLLDDDPAPWSAWWSAHGGRAEHGVRYRFGHRYSLLDTLDELAPGGGFYGDRHHAAMELAVRGGRPVPLDRDDFVLVQKHWLAEAQAIYERSPATGWTPSLTR